MESTAEEARVLKFFQSGKKVEFDELSTSLITGRVNMNSSVKINQKALFDNLDIYEIPGWVRSKKMKIDLPHPGVPFAILSARLGTEVKGIIKDRKILEKPKKSGKLSERLSFDFSVQDTILNIMVFSSMIKISGGTGIHHLAQAFKFFKALLLMIARRGVNVIEDFPIATQIHIDMVNVAFDLGYAINKQAMRDCFKKEDKLVELCPEKEELQICYKMGREKSNGDDRFYIFRVRHSGKIMFTGDDRKKMKPFYDHFMKIVQDNEHVFRFD